MSENTAWFQSLGDAKSAVIVGAEIEVRNVFIKGEGGSSLSTVRYYVRTRDLLEEDTCPGCGGPISDRYKDKGVCHNCYGTTDDPWMRSRVTSPAGGRTDA